MLSTVLSTGLCLLLASVAGLAAYAAVRAMERTEDTARTFDKDVRQLAGLRLEVTALESRLNRVVGRVYAVQRHEKGKAAPSAAADEEPAQSDLNGLDPDLAAELALQNAPPVAPGTRR